MPLQGPTVVRRQLGRRLRRLREAAGKTDRDLEEANLLSRAKLWRIETGELAEYRQIFSSIQAKSIPMEEFSSDSLRVEKSSKSGGNGGECVEVRQHDETIQVRDSKDPSGAVLAFTTDEWHAFVEGAKVGEFD